MLHFRNHCLSYNDTRLYTTMHSVKYPVRGVHAAYHKKKKKKKKKKRLENVYLYHFTSETSLHKADQDSSRKAVNRVTGPISVYIPMLTYIRLGGQPVFYWGSGLLTVTKLLQGWRQLETSSPSIYTNGNSSRRNAPKWTMCTYLAGAKSATNSVELTLSVSCHNGTLHQIKTIESLRHPPMYSTMNYEIIEQI